MATEQSQSTVSSLGHPPRSLNGRRALPLVWVAWMGGAALLGGGIAAVDLASQDPGDKPTEKTGFCTNAACHNSYMTREFMHDPAADLDCESCHEYASAERHLFRLTKPKADLCSGCHTLELDAVVHQPVADHDCTGCHDPHGSEHRMMLVDDPADGLCFTCHDDAMLTQEFVHGPVAVQACVLCHAPHSSGNPGLLTMSPKRICVDCHARMEPSGPEARHLHKPMEEGCASCHDPHASPARYQLLDDQPKLCLNCHTGVQSDLEAAEVVHGPVTTDGGCATCHNPHFTTLPKLQKFPQPDLCLDCHDEPLATEQGDEIDDMAALLEDNPNHHGPIRDGGCTECHQPHAENHYRLLHQEYPAEFYAPYKPERYELCFTCHLSDLVKDESGTGLTNFRDGDQNLHWLHVNREKGRTCRACHEVHASKRPFHIREAVPFGSSGWMLEINFEKTDEGGTCLPACHKKHEYNRTALGDAPETGAASSGG